MRIKNLKVLAAAVVLVGGIFGGGFQAAAARVENSAISVDQEMVRQGENVEVTFGLEEVSQVNKGINAVKGTIQYDESVFENLNAEDFSMLNSWESLQYNPKNHQFVAVKKGGTLQAEAVFTVSLQAKRSAAAGETNVSVREISVSEGMGDILPSDSEAVVSIVSTAGLGQPQDGGAGEQGEKAPSSMGEERQSQVPMSGDRGVITFLIVVAVFAVFTAFLAISVRRKKRVNLRHIRVFLGVVAVTALTALIVGGVYATGKKGELNGDGTVDHADMVLLEKHLVGIEFLADDKKGLADMNRDGVLTVTDLSLLLEKIEQNTDYKVILSSDVENFYPQKNEEFELKFTADISPAGRISSVVVDGTEYTAYRGETDSQYAVRINVGNVAGLKTFHMTEVILDGGQRVPVDFTETVDVLKAEPSVANFRIEQADNSGKVAVDLNLEDEDDSILSSVMNITERVEDQETLFESVELQKGENQFDFTLQEDKTYIFNIVLQYNLDSDKLTEHEEDHSGSKETQKEFQVNIDYQLTFSNLKSYNDTMTETGIFGKNEPVILQFDSTNVTQYVPDQVKIGGKFYPVTVEGGRCTVRLEGFSQTGEHEVKIDAVILDNGKQFTLEQDNSIAILVQKEKPQISKVNISEEVDFPAIRTAFEVSDPDGTIVTKKVVILDENGGQIAAVPFTDNKFDQRIELPDNLYTSYTVRVVADYSLTGDESGLLKDQILYEEVIKALPRVAVDSVQFSSNKLEKGESVDVTYQIRTNHTADIEKLVVNNIELEAAAVSGGQYRVTVQLQNDAGKQTVTLAQVVFSDNTLVNTNISGEVEVLKSAPSVENVSTEEDFENSLLNISFDVKDDDKAFVSGKAKLLSDSGLAEQTKDVSVGKNELEFSVKEDESYTFQILATYATSEDGGDYTYEDQVIYTTTVQMIRDYNLSISDIRSEDSQGESEKYFGKNEEIALSFTGTTNTALTVSEAWINGSKYTLTSLGNDRYSARVPGYKTAGVQTLALEKVVMSNQKELKVQDESVKIEILKDAPSAEQFSSEQTGDDKLKFSFTLQDDDKALVSSVITVTDGDGASLLRQDVKEGENEAEINLTASTVYKVQITASYDLDTNALDSTSNSYTDITLFEDEIDASKDVVEFKDVISNELYRENSEGKGERVTSIDVSSGLPSDVENYYAIIEMAGMPKYYAAIQEFRKTDDPDNILAVIDQEEVIQYSGEGMTRKGEYSFTVPSAGSVSGTEAAEAFFREMSNNLQGTFEMTRDLDASTLSSGDAAVLGSFSGTLNGNGYTIFNLKKPLFHTLNGAKVHDLVIEDANITLSNAKGILANQATDATFESVYVVDSSLSNNQNMIGGFTGELINSSVSKSAAINISVSGANTIGGISGQLSKNTTVEDTYVTGSLAGNSTHSLGARVGGITGWHSGKAIERCFTKVKITAPKATGNGGLIGGPQNNHAVVKNSLSMSGGSAYRIAGFNALNNMEGVYEWSGSDALTQADSSNKIQEISEIYNESFYAGTLGFSKDIWNFDLLGHEALPSLQGDPIPKTLIDYEIDQNANSIPNYAEVRKNADYNSAREIAYANMAMLMPFADTAVWVERGNSLSDTETLAVKRISYVFPLDGQRQLVSVLQNGEENAISSIRIVYEDDSREEAPVTFVKQVGGIAALYSLGDRGIGYQFHDYIMYLDSGLLTKAVEQAQGYDYDSSIAALTFESESRLYIDYYNEQVKTVLSDVIVKWIGSNENIPTYCGQKTVQSQIEDRALNENDMKRFLYGYNYIDKWYHIHYDGVILSDLLFFDGEMIHDSLTAEYLTGQILGRAASTRDTKNTHTFYANVLQGQTGMGMLDFLGWLAEAVAGYDNPSDWMQAEFDGILKEQAPSPDNGTLKYRIWDIFESLGSGTLSDRTNIVLPILTAPQEDMYLISIPSQLMIGSLNRYSDYQKPDGRELMKARIDNIAEKLGHFYGVSANLVPNSEEILNGFANIEYDTRAQFPASGDITSGTQERGTTNDPVLKWVYEAVNEWPAKNGSGAYATGTNVYWVAYAALDDKNIEVISHETAHNQDGRYFYGGTGRRSGTGSESHADGNIAQQISNGSMVFNLSREMDITADVTNNFSYTRIDTPEEIWDYYKDMFETGYVLEYLAGQAFLSLTPEQQAKLAVQVNFEESSYSSLTGKYNRLDAAAFEAMHLQDMEDLWDNRIAFKSAGTASSGWSGTYGYESFYDSNWFQPYNDAGVSTANSFKRLGQEMLGVAGYENGYIAYMSGKSSNDLDALRKITGDESITWKSYKMDRYKTVEANLANIPYFDSDEVIKQFKVAMEEDILNGTRTRTDAVKSLLYGIVKRATNDFTDGTVYEAPQQISVTSASQLVELAESNLVGNYRLEADIDFTGIEPKDGAYVANQFIGVLDGNGHKITGMRYPLFRTVLYSQVKDLVIDSPAYEDDAASALAVESKNFTVENISITNGTVYVPLVASITGSYYEYGTNSIEVSRVEIDTVEEFLSIDDTSINLSKKYVLTQDLDFSASGTYGIALSGTFRGELDGNGHTISNLNAVMFESMSGASVKNLGITGGQVTGNGNKGKLANTITDSTVEKVYLGNFSINNAASQVGGLAGQITGSTVREVSLENIRVKGNDTVGGLAGQINTSTVTDCIVTGTVQGTYNNPSLGARVGGITGWLSAPSSLENCYTKVEILSPKATGSGGLVGGPNNNNVNITNSISMSSGTNAYRIAGFDTLGASSNVFEYTNSDSVTNIKESNSERVKAADDTMIVQVGFYTGNLGWSEEIWDLSGIASGGTPRLKGALITPGSDHMPTEVNQTMSESDESLEEETDPTVAEGTEVPEETDSTLAERAEISEETDSTLVEEEETAEEIGPPFTEKEEISEERPAA